jgi:hypothetical protein
MTYEKTPIHMDAGPKHWTDGEPAYENNNCKTKMI